jgi:hypothetical protein
MMPNAKIVFSDSGKSSASIQQEIVDIIYDTEYELNIAMYRFLNEDILNAIEEKVEEGITFNMILDTTVKDTDEYAEYFFNQMVEPLKNLQMKYPKRVKIKFMPNDTVMHHKLLISDRRILVTGSYNMTRSAEDKNLENIFIYESEEDNDIIAKALRAFFGMLGVEYTPKPLEINKISVRKGIYLNNVFTSIENIYDDDIFIIRGMSLSFWVHGEGIFCTKVTNRYGRKLIVHDHFLYDTDTDDELNLTVIGIDGTSKDFKYIVKLMPWKLPYSEEFKNYMDERFKLLTQKLKYSGLI